MNGSSSEPATESLDMSGDPQTQLQRHWSSYVKEPAVSKENNGSSSLVTSNSSADEVQACCVGYLLRKRGAYVDGQITGMPRAVISADLHRVDRSPTRLPLGLGDAAQARRSLIIGLQLIIIIVASR
jgi:hypothetical protein